jgi:hypothetical protein
MRTWRVTAWENEPTGIKRWYPLNCACGQEAMCPSYGTATVVAGKGMGLVPEGGELIMPTEIQCRRCGKSYYDWGSTDGLRQAIR